MACHDDEVLMKQCHLIRDGDSRGYYEDFATQFMIICVSQTVCNIVLKVLSHVKFWAPCQSIGTQNSKFTYTDD